MKSIVMTTSLILAGGAVMLASNTAFAHGGPREQNQYSHSMDAKHVIECLW